jgi:pantoate--beta-alanine ligase
MKVFTTQKELKRYLNTLSPSANQIGLVPTMGALHIGHLSLIEESKKHNHFTIASIFVNPTQFDKKEDLEKYPRTLDKDLDLLQKKGCDAVFTPSIKDIYPQDVSSQKFDFDGLENEMEGKFRMGHFDGVGTIVKALFDIVAPTNAYFGEKDFQQLQVIRKMVEKYHLPVRIVGCPIYREPHGLAMSSRNERLSKEQRQEAAIIFTILSAVKEKASSFSPDEITSWVQEQLENHPLFDLEYFTIADENTLQTALQIEPKKSYRAFIAVYADSIRLIDNLSLQD